MMVARTLLLLVVVIGLGNQAFAQSLDSLEAEIAELEFDGLVVDETITKIGRDFYEIFFSKWSAPTGIKDYIILISEKLLPRFGTRVAIKINDIVIFERFVQPRYAAIEESAGYGMRAALRYLHEYDQVRKNLESEDLSGNGIF